MKMMKVSVFSALAASAWGLGLVSPQAAAQSPYEEVKRVERQFAAEVRAAVVRGEAIDAKKLLADVAEKKDGDARSLWRYATELHTLCRRLMEERQFARAREFALEEERTLEEAIRLAANDRKLRSQCLYLLGSLNDGVLGRPKEAAQLFTQAAALDSENKAIRRAVERSAKHLRTN